MILWYRYHHKLNSPQEIQESITSLVGSEYTEGNDTFGIVKVALECDGEMFLALYIGKGDDVER